MRHECSTLTILDATLQLGLIWPLDGGAVDDDLGAIMMLGVADSPTARRLQVLFSAHAAAGQPLTQRIAAYCAIARLMITQGLPDIEDAEDRECRDAFHAALERAQSIADGTAPADVAASDDELWHELATRLERFEWPEHPDTRSAMTLLWAGIERDDRAGTAWARAAEMLASLAMLVSEADLELVMQRAAQVVYGCLFPKAA